MFVLGVDLGQARDYTALAVVERHGEEDHLRHLERLPLGTDYPSVVAHVIDLRRQLPGCLLAVDATGVGRPVIDMLRGSGEQVMGVSITGGKTVAQGADGLVRVPKAQLVQAVAGGLETGRLKVAQGLPLVDVLIRELRAFRASISAAGRTKFEGGKGEHDDVVLAVALALWQPSRCAAP